MSTDHPNANQHLPATAFYHEERLRRNVLRMNEKVEEAKVYLDENDFSATDTLQLHNQLVAMAVARVDNLLSSAHKHEIPKELYMNSLEDLHNAEETLVQLNHQVSKIDPPKHEIPLPPTPTPRHSVGLPQRTSNQLDIKVQKFNGERSKYALFKRSIEIVCTKKNASPAEQVLFTMEHLEGKPAQLVENIPPTEDGLALLWTLLDNEFDDPARVRNEIYLKLEEMPESADDPIAMKETLDSIEAALRVLELQEDDELISREDTYKRLVLSKFPNSLIRYIARPGEELTLDETRANLRQVLVEEVRRHAFLEPIRRAKSKQSPPSANTAASPNPGAATTWTKATGADKSSFKEPPKQPPRPCPYCKELHWADHCPKVPSVEARLALLSNACTVCLRSDHRKESCTWNRVCFYCREKGTHHSSLCTQRLQSRQEATTKSVPAPVATAKPTIKVSDTTNLINDEKYGTYLTATAFVRNPETKRSIQARILIDPGSSRTYIHERVSQAINLRTSKEQILTMKRFNDDTPLRFPSTTTNFEILNDESVIATITANTTPEITDSVPMISPEQFLEQHPEHSKLKFADIGMDWPIDIMVGNDYAFQLLTCSNKISVGTLQLIDSVFGYLICGHTNGQRDTHDTSAFFSTSAAVDRISTLDVLGITDAHRTANDNEAAAIQQFYTHVKLVDNRYEVPLLWKIDPSFPGTFGLAIGRLWSNLKRLERNQEILKKYNDIFQQQLANGIIEEVTSNPPQNRSYYIPHQPVINMEKSTTPIRIVFDASAKASKSAPSLNETLYKGINKLEDITAILIRFRTYRIALVADIEKAYHALQLREEDRDFCRFLWVKDITKPIDDSNIIKYRFLRIAFGLTSSMFLLNATIAHHIANHPSEFSAELTHDFYVDNLLTGTQNEEAAIRLHYIAAETFESCSMNLRCWSTNSAAVRSQFAEEKREIEETIKMLGIKWHAANDSISLPKISCDPLKDPTLRSILKQTAKLYDPLGLFAPVVVRAKILMQKIRSAGYLWDDKLPINLRDCWAEIAHDIQHISDLQFPRYLQLSQDIELHAFADASAKGYGTAIYAKSNKSVHLLFAKARVAPLRTLTIPKLELLAATIAARALQFVEKSLRNITITKRTLWSDSKCIIAQIKTTKILPTYVENRVREIRTISNLQVNYVPTNLNIADIASRGCTLDELPAQWFHGPDFLSEDESTWPKQEQIELHLEPAHDDISKPIDTVMLLNVENPKPPVILLMDIERFNSLPKLLTTASVIITFLLRKIPKLSTRIPELVTKPRTVALRWFLHQEQQRHYADVFTALEAQKSHPLIKKFRLVKDVNGLLHCRGRFEFASSPTSVKFPTLLPRANASHLTRLIILQAHENNFHTGTNHTLTAIRRQYWIPAGRAAVFSTIRKCTKCKWYTALPYEQPSDAKLPEYRISPENTVWQHTGFDILGPLLIENQKMWILLFTCMATRAVSLEPLESMNAEHVVLAFRAFIARRALPAAMLSDQGSQFQAVIEILKLNLSAEIEWRPLPGKSPWMGGVYERLVGITKNAFDRTFHKTQVTKNIFRTVLFEIENTINSRPITYLENDIGYAPLTPNHFLAKPDFATEQEPSPKEIRGDRAFLQALWRFISNTRTQFWNAWASQYLALLRERHETDQNHFKKRTTKLEPKIDEIVLISETNKKRKNWNIARIVELSISTDGKIRSAKLRLPSGNIISRPVQDLYPLEISS